MSWLRDPATASSSSQRERIGSSDDEDPSPRTNRSDSWSKRVGSGLINILNKYNPGGEESINTFTANKVRATNHVYSSSL
jgi:hypothetical protein